MPFIIYDERVTLHPIPSPLKARIQPVPARSFIWFPFCLALSPQEQNPDEQIISEAALDRLFANDQGPEEPDPDTPKPADDPESPAAKPGESSGEPGDGQANAPGESQADSPAASDARPSKQAKSTA